MKVVVVLALLAVAAFAVVEKKRLIGGPDSLPFWLKPGYTGKQPPFHLDDKPTTPKKRLIGGPDSLPFWLKPGYTGKQPPHHLDHLKKDTETPAETSGFTELKNKAKEHATNAVNKVKQHGKRAHDWIKGKLGKKTETAAPAPAPVEEPVQESAFAKVKEHLNRAKEHIKTHVNKAKNWVKGKFGKKTETATPEPTPAPVEEQPQEAAFGKVKEHLSKAKEHVKTHLNKAKNWVKGKFGKKTETATPEPTPAPVEEPAQESAFIDDAKETATNALNKAKEHTSHAMDKVKEHGKRFHDWIKSKLNKNAPEATTQ